MIRKSNRRVGSRIAGLIAVLAALAIGNAVAAEAPARAASTPSETDDSETLVDIPDAVLRGEVERRLGKAPGDPITRGEMANLTVLHADGARQLAGIEHAVNLETLFAGSPTADEAEYVLDLAPLAGLTSLTYLYLSRSGIVDLGPLAGLTSLKTLDLSGNEIVDLGPLAEAALPSLKTLYLSSNGIVDLGPLAGLTSLGWLYLSGNEIVDLGPLAGLTSLVRLGLGSNGIVDLDLGPLAGLTSLTTLDLRWNGIVDLDLGPLAGLTSLKTLDLSGNGIVDLDLGPLAGLTSLTTLYLRNNGIVDLGPRAELPSLTTLDLLGNDIVDLGPLAGLTSLTTLDLQYNEIVDVGPLAGLTSLLNLGLASNRVRDAAPLVANDGLGCGDYVTLDRWSVNKTHISMLRRRGVDIDTFAAWDLDEEWERRSVDIPDEILRQAIEQGVDQLTRRDLASLERLDVEGVRQLTGIEHACGLRELDLARGSIEDLGPLAEAALPSLTTLSLDSNRVADLGPLAEAALPSLTTLSLDSNRVADLGPLAEAALPSLTTLSLDSNRVADLGPLAEAALPSLTTLSLDSNRVADLGPLTGLRSLTTLSLDSNAVADLRPLRYLTSLTTLSLDSNAVVELWPLNGLTSLTTLRLDSNLVFNLSALTSMTSLTTLGLSDNVVRDLSPLLVDGRGWIGADGARIDLRWNPLSWVAHDEHIPIIRRRGEVLFTLIDDIPDTGLRAAISRVRWLWQNRLHNIEVLDASNRDIEDLTGIEGASKLIALNLSGNKIQDITRLRHLWDLFLLAMDDNLIHDLPPVSVSSSRSMFHEVEFLYLANNSLSDIASLAATRLLQELDVSGNEIASLAPLAHALFLRYLHVHDNQITDIAPLNFAPLRELHMRNNAVRDISPLLDGEGLLMVDVRRNPLADGALDVLETLRERRVTVLAGETVPYFPAAGRRREGFVRVVNRSDEDGHVFIEAVDDAGVRAGPVRLEIGARRAAHFNSGDLEHGNTSKGLDGVGAPSAGDWRLSVISALDVEVLSYIRTGDGFVTAMHDVAADGVLPFFNPGSNESQRSILRVVNTEAEPGKFTTGGRDDGGSDNEESQFHPMAGTILVRPQHALTLTAQELENEHGLGDGRGKWRLFAHGFPWLAMGLLESPTGHLTNLSTAPAHVTPLEDGLFRRQPLLCAESLDFRRCATMHRLPLFPAAGGSREGFVRLINNRSYGSAELVIEAVDDAGARFGPMRLTMQPLQAVHFNSTDLEAGNAAKGLDGGVGVGEGDWRLEVTDQGGRLSEVELTVLAYARTADGFLTSLHDLAPVAEDGSHRVVFFNPGSNTRQVSKLRLINDGDLAAGVMITGIDDQGSDSDTVWLTVPAGGAYTFTSAELETGEDDRLTGGLGDGAGKWRLRVESDEQISVMSLLETPSGHLTNVSTGTAD